ncbi:AAA family ATPase [Pseudomonas putida]|uniref:AAA family ATPase n=1 Tax=Pseudomonas putida TaxID=303 RepID=UPI0039E00546
MNNLPIQFLSVEISNFRGVPGKLTVPLNAPLTVIYAANGTGKSTICFALEWLLTGGIEGIDSKDHACEWGDGETSVSAQCLIGGVSHELVRKRKGLWLSKQGSKPVKMTDDKLLALLTPSTISGKSDAITKKSKRGWLRNSRWLYSNSLSLLIDNNRATDRQQIFADILGFGHLSSTLRELKDYKKALPSTKGLTENIFRLNADIENTQRSLQQHAPGRAKALANLKLLADNFNFVLSGDNFPHDVREAKLRVQMFEQRTQSRFEDLTELQSQWEHFHGSLKQVDTLRRSISDLSEESLKLTEQHKKGSDELGAANIKYDEGKRSVEWANEKLIGLKSANSLIALPSIARYFLQSPVTHASLSSVFAELSWDKGRQDSWRTALDYLEKNVGEVDKLVREQRRLEESYVYPPSNLEEVIAVDGLAKEDVIRQTAKFDALADTSERLKNLGVEFLSVNETHICPLCTHDWPSAELLRTKVKSKELMSAAIKEALEALDNARGRAQLAAFALAEAKALQQLHEQSVKQINAAKAKLSSFEAKTKYLQVTGEQDFSTLSPARVRDLKERIFAAIELQKIFDNLPDSEIFFSLVPKVDFKGRVEQLMVALENYVRHYQRQVDEVGPERIRLDQLVKGVAAAIKVKSGQMTGYSASVTGFTTAIDRFMTLWTGVTDGGEVTEEKWVAAMSAVERERAQVTEFKKLLDECEAVVNVDSDASALKKLTEQLSYYQSKLDIGSRYIVAADQAIEQYEAHVKELTSSSLGALLGPAGELFSRMHANEVYQGLGVSEGTEHLHWTAFAEDHEIALDAESKFSQGQRQDLALSLYLARARNTGGSFFLDEPIAHLDDLNRVAMLDIFRLLATSNPSMSLVLTTASESLARHMAQKFSSINDRQLLNMVYLEGNPRAGIQISVNGKISASELV